MNIERGITYMAALTTVVIVLANTFGLQNRIPFFAFGKQETVAVTTSRKPVEVAKMGDIADLQALAEYEATLSAYPVNPNRTANAGDTPVEQIADLQALASYQASLPVLHAAPHLPKQSRPRIVDQIANLQELDQYQEAHARDYVDVTAR